MGSKICWICDGELGQLNEDMPWGRQWSPFYLWRVILGQDSLTFGEKQHLLILVLCGTYRLPLIKEELFRSFIRRESWLFTLNLDLSRKKTLKGKQPFFSHNFVSSRWKIKCLKKNSNIFFLLVTKCLLLENIFSCCFLY